MSAGMLEWARRLHPFTTPESQRLALLFGVVYFAQGMWYLPNQAITIVLKDRGLTAGQVADVLTDAMMVENGRPRGLTGAFQSVQWACITVATVLVGLLGGYFAEHRSLQAAFLLAAAFPIVSLLMGVFLVREPRSRFDAAAL